MGSGELNNTRLDAQMTDSTKPAEWPNPCSLCHATPPCQHSHTITKVTLLESDLPKLVIGGALSMRSTFQIRVDGFFEKKERDALRKMLDAQLALLDEADD